MNRLFSLLVLIAFCTPLCLSSPTQQEATSATQSGSTTSLRLPQSAVARLLSEADPRVASIQVVKSLMKYRNSGSVSCHSEEAKIAETHFAKTGTLTTEDATRVVQAYLDCVRQQGSGPAIEGVANTKAYVSAIDKKLQGATDDPLSTVASGIQDVEAALDRQDYIQALVNYEALRAGSAAVYYSRAHAITGADISTNLYTRQPAFSWTSAYWSNIPLEPGSLTSEDVPFANEYLEQTAALAQDLRSAVETEARLTVAANAVTSQDPLRAKTLCDSAEQLLSRISDSSIHGRLSSRLAQVRKLQIDREAFLKQSMTLAFENSGSTMTFQLVSVGPDGTSRKVLSCGEQISCVNPVISGTLSLNQTADSRIRVRFKLNDSSIKSPSGERTTSRPAFAPGSNFDFDIELDELWPSRNGINLADHTFSSTLRFNGTQFKTPDHAISFTEKVPTPVSVPEALSDAADREYVLNVHLYPEEAGPVIKNMNAALNKQLGPFVIDEMLFSLKIRGKWKAVSAIQQAPEATKRLSSQPANSPTLNKYSARRTLTVYKGSDRTQADRIAGALLKQFLPAFVISRSQEKPPVFEVQVGPFTTDAEVSYASEQITKSGFKVLP